MKKTRMNKKKKQQRCGKQRSVRCITSDAFCNSFNYCIYKYSELIMECTFIHWIFWAVLLRLWKQHNSVYFIHIKIRG